MLRVEKRVRHDLQAEFMDSNLHNASRLQVNLHRKDNPDDSFVCVSVESVGQGRTYGRAFHLSTLFLSVAEAKLLRSELEAALCEYNKSDSDCCCMFSESAPCDKGECPALDFS